MSAESLADNACSYLVYDGFATGVTFDALAPVFFAVISLAEEWPGTCFFGDLSYDL